jgi:hypothetical protein
MAAEDTAAVRRTTGGRRAALPAWVARGALVALAVVAGAVGVQALRHHGQCDTAYARLQAVRATTSPADALAAANDLVSSCPVTRQTLVPVFALAGRHQGAALLTVAKRITRDTPEDYQGWLLLLFAAEGRDPQLTNTAKLRLVHLVPALRSQLYPG